MTPSLEVPTDFPSRDAPAGLAGVQLKFSVVRDSDGQLRPAGSSLEERRQRYVECCRLVDWAVPFLQERAGRPKYAEHSPAQLLELLGGNLSSDLRLFAAERDWVLRHVADRLGWGAPLVMPPSSPGSSVSG